MEAFNFYTLSTSGWLSLQALPLLLAPKVLVLFLSPTLHETTQLEIYLSRCLGITLITLSLVSLSLSGLLPFSAVPEIAPSSQDSQPENPFATPTTLLTTLHHAALAIYQYRLYSSTGSAGFLLGFLGSVALACLGGWCVLFWNDKHVSKRTGMDKRVSRWPFGGPGRKSKGGKGL